MENLGKGAVAHTMRGLSSQTEVAQLAVTGACE